MSTNDLLVFLYQAQKSGLVESETNSFLDAHVFSPMGLRLWDLCISCRQSWQEQGVTPSQEKLAVAASAIVEVLEQASKRRFTPGKRDAYNTMVQMWLKAGTRSPSVLERAIERDPGLKSQLVSATRRMLDQVHRTASAEQFLRAIFAVIEWQESSR